MTEPLDDHAPLETEAVPDDVTEQFTPSPPAAPPGPVRRHRSALGGPAVQVGIPALFGLGALVALGAALSLPLAGMTVPPPVAAAPADVGPAPIDVKPAEAALTDLMQEAEKLSRRVQDAATEGVAVALESDLTDLMQEVRTARETRRKQRRGGKKVSLSAPFSGAELKDAKTALALGPDRFIIGRDGSVTLPADARLPKGVDLSSSTKDTDRMVKILSETEDRVTVLGRACLAYEKHCLVEVKTIPKPLLDAIPLKSALAALAAAPATDPKTTVAPPAPPRAEPQNDVTARNILFGLALFLALGGLLSAWLITRRVLAPLGRLDETLHHLAHGQPVDGQTWAAGLSGLAALDRELAELRPDAEKAARLTATVQRLATALSSAAHGALDRRLDLDDEDEDVRAVITAAHQLLDAVQEHSEQTAAARTPKFKERVDRLRPVPQLLSDVAKRLTILSARADEPLAQELTKLAGQLGPRAATVGKLLDKLESAPAEGQPQGPVFGQNPFDLFRRTSQNPPAA